MNSRDIFTSSLEFYNLTKHADLRSNMAKRIMFSLLSHLVPAGESARSHYTKGVIDFKALKQMIPGAKELLNYGTRACLDEARTYAASPTSKTPNDLGRQLLNQAKAAFENDQIPETLKILEKMFLEAKWLPSFGGKPWATISSTLLKIYNQLKLAEEAKKNYDYELEADMLMEMVAYINVLDGLAHNTGSIMDKMLTLQQFEQLSDEPFTAEQIQQNDEELAKINRMMDAKELKDPDDVLQEIMPTLEKSDAPLTMKDWMHKARQRNYQGSHEERETKLEKIRNKKLITALIQEGRLTEISNTIRSWSNLADNILINRVPTIAGKLNSLKYVAKKLKDNVIVPPEIRQEINLKLKSINTILEENLTEIAETQGYYKVRKLLWDVLQLISDIESIPEKLTEE